MENIYAILPTNHRRARIVAFIVAFILYLLIAAALLLELKPLLEQKYNDYFPPSTSPNASLTQPKTHQRSAPAPVKYMQRPSAPTPSAAAQMAPAPAPLPTPIPQQVPPVAPATPAPSQPKKTPPASEKELPKTPERIIHQSQTTQTMQPTTTAPINNATSPDDSEQETDQNSTPYPRKRLRERFYKNGRIPQQTASFNSPPQSHNYPSVGAQLTQGFSDHMYQRQAHEEETSLTNEKNTKGHDSALEAQLFMHAFGRIFCTNSYNNQLRVHTSLIQPHRIELMITCNKQRKVIAVRFIKNSYDQHINDYINELLTTMLTPQIPASVTTSEVTFPISIELERVYQRNTIYFVQGSKRK